MVYINDGAVCQSPPWSLDRLVKLLYGVVAFFIYFFQTLVGLDTSKSKGSSSRWSGGSTFRSGGGGGGGGGGGRPFGPGGGGGGGGGPRIRTMRDINPPTVNGGGCPGGSCGM